MLDRQAAIRAERLAKRFGKTEALRELDLEVEAGTVFALLGPNGAGKTTAVRIFATLVRPDSGRAEVAGFDVVRHPDQVRARIGLTGQYAAVDEHRTAWENLQMFGRLYGLSAAEAWQRAEELVVRFGLIDAAGRLVKTYSGGIRRRLDLAASLIAHPPVLFLDEPTTGLDPRSRQELWDVVRELVASGTTVLLTTQYLEEADHLANQIAVIDQGWVLALGSPDELKTQVGGEYLEATISGSTDLDRAAQVLAPYAEGRVHVDADRRHVVLRIRSGGRLLANVVKDLEGARVFVDDLTLRRPSLDEVFHALTGGTVVNPLVRTDDGPRQEARATLIAATSLRPVLVEPRRKRGLVWWLSDVMVLTRRNLAQIPRVPEQLAFATTQPILFLLLFR